MHASPVYAPQVFAPAQGITVNQVGAARGMGTTPIAAVGVDTNRNGRADFVYVGADRNRDGVPDSMHQHSTGAPVLLGSTSVTAQHAKPHTAAVPTLTVTHRSSNKCDCGNAASILCLTASLCTIVLGVIYVFQKVGHASSNVHWGKGDLHFSSCGFSEADCNGAWRQVFSLRPSILCVIWTPMFLGIVGASIHIKSLVLCSLFHDLHPSTYSHYAMFMLTNALIANIGYTGKCGVLIGVISLIAAILCVVARLCGHVLIQTLSFE